MDRLLFRCIDTLVDSSDLERRAYNAAFAETGLEWDWSEERFCGLLKIVGERHRISWYAENVLGQRMSSSRADLILWKKEQVLKRLLCTEVAPPLPGVLRLLSEAAEAQISAVATVSTITQRRVLNQSAEHFKYSSILSVKSMASARRCSSTASIEFDATRSVELIAQDVSHPLIAVSSTVSKEHACITHYGEYNNPAVQLSGTSIIQRGNASLQALLSLCQPCFDAIDVPATQPDDQAHWKL